jgi:hypothetical protein
MNLQTITMPRDEAAKLYEEYRELVDAGLGTEVDRQTMEGLAALAKGAKIINLRDAVLAGGFDALGRPKLAIARAHWNRCEFINVGTNSFPRYVFAREGANLWGRNITRMSAHAIQIRNAPANALLSSGRRWSAVLPTIPPRHRPRGRLNRFTILWEADWTQAPGDPALLRQIGATWLYVVLAEWDLTPLERMVLTQSMQTGD